MKGKGETTMGIRVPPVFVLLSAVGLYFSQLTPLFVLNEVIVRLIRDGIMVLALVVPITAGMGLNFAVVIGAMCAQVGLILAVDFQISGFSGLALILAIGAPLALFCGWVIGTALNRVRGREMITTIIMGFVATSIYQLIFMVGYGTLITPHNQEMMLSRGIGVRNMVDLSPFANLLETIWVIQIHGVEIPLFMLLLVCGCGLAIAYLLRTRLGMQLQAVGQDPEKAGLLGLNVAGVRIRAIMISTLLACLGHMIYIQNIGMLNVYTAHLNTDIFSCAALLAGGATISRARIRHAFIGIFLFHTLFIVSPQAGRNLFGNAALGEYFRSFVAYGTIAFALIMNHRQP
jgi:simple sugar transport system permease protein